MKYDYKNEAILSYKYSKNKKKEEDILFLILQFYTFIYIILYNDNEHSSIYNTLCYQRKRKYRIVDSCEQKTYNT